MEQGLISNGIPSGNSDPSMGKQQWPFVQDHYFSARKEEYLQRPMQDERVVEVLSAWGVAYIPLFIQKGIEFAQEIAKKENDHDVVERIMFDQIVKWVHNTAAIIHKGIKNSPAGTNPFVLDHHWHNPAESLPRRSRVFKREEPLQFPEEVPPHGQTHCIG